MSNIHTDPEEHEQHFNRGGVSEVVVQEKTGFLVNSVEEIVQAIGKVDQIDPLERREHVREHFSGQAMVLAYLELYRQLLSSTSQACGLKAYNQRTKARPHLTVVATAQAESKVDAKSDRR